MRRPSNAARDMIKRREALRLVAYPDVGGVWTIGFGHTRGVHEGMRISEQQAADYLVADAMEAVQTIYAQLPPAIVDAWPQACFDAMVSFVFNVGAQAFRNPRTGARTDFYRACIGADMAEVARQMQRWVKVGGRVIPGLVARRGEEAALWGAGIRSLAIDEMHEERVVQAEFESTTPEPPQPPRAIQQPGMVTGAAVGAGGAGVAAAAATLSSAGTGMSMSGDRAIVVIGLALIVVGAIIMVWLARR